MAKKRTINELRQTKDAVYTNPGAKTNNLLYTRPAVPEGGGNYERGDIASDEGKKYLDIAGDEFMIKEAKDLIVNNLQNHFYDIIFDAVSNEMDKNYLFRQNNYLTEAGAELFEDAWFEWYHEHHGDIVSRVLKRLEP